MLGFPRHSSQFVGPHTISTIRATVGNCEAQILFPSTGIGGSVGRYARQELPDGLSAYTKMPRFLFKHLAQSRHPCVEGAEPLQQHDAAQGWPVVVFSHGLGGCAEMYTGMCASLASCGHIVIALEHRDGSACFAREASGALVPYKQFKANAADISMYKRFGPSSAYSKERLVTFRAPFLATRARELRAAIEQVVGSSDPTPATDDDGAAFPSDPSANVDRVMATADTSTVHLLGHSFGAASVLLVGQELEQELRAHEASASPRVGVEPPPQSIGTVSLLDPWLSSAGEGVVARGLDAPLLAALSRGWCEGQEFNYTRALSPAASYCLPLAQHTSFSDAPNWFPGVLTKKTGLRGRREPLHAVHADVAPLVAAHIAGTRAERVDQLSPNAMGKRKGKSRWPWTRARAEPSLVEPLGI